MAEQWLMTETEKWPNVQHFRQLRFHREPHPQNSGTIYESYDMDWPMTESGT
jgi:hypothetical protein